MVGIVKNVYVKMQISSLFSELSKVLLEKTQKFEIFATTDSQHVAENNTSNTVRSNCG